jgi:hypothetical protein
MADAGSEGETGRASLFPGVGTRGAWGPRASSAPAGEGSGGRDPRPASRARPSPGLLANHQR